VLSARLAYAMMCLTLTWGVLTSIGLVNRLTGRQALRTGHLVLATITLTFAGVHVVSFLMMRAHVFTPAELFVPFGPDNKFRHTAGTLAFEGMLLVAIFSGLQRWTSYWRWLWIHRLAYPAFGLGVAHAFLGATANGSISGLWLAGITLLIPALVVAVLRFLPAKALATAGLLEDAP
jgi:sulfoxide reductase heme-binding subunit YedZ